MSYEYIRFDIAEGVARLVLNRPQTLNAVHRPMLDEVLHAFDRLRTGGEARVLLFTGAGRAFCSGADLSPDAWDGKSVAAPSVDAGRILETHLNPIIEQWYELPVPIVTAVNGAAAGAGCSLALAGDIVIAGRSAYFLQAFINIGLVPDVGSTWLLPRLAGRARAQAMMMLGERIGAQAALDWGMIYEVVDDGQLMGRAESLCRKLAKGPTQAYRLLRQGIRACLDSTLSEGLLVERRNQRLAGLTDDYREGVAAFVEKRAPNFKGH
jgi:2-(1,2-epoxy-1,2-dihydrophenyl)acetyl-CoA isomerase